MTEDFLQEEIDRVLLHHKANYFVLGGETELRKFCVACDSQWPCRDIRFVGAIDERDSNLTNYREELAEMTAICEQQDKTIRDLVKENADLIGQLNDLDAGIGGFHVHN